MVISDAGSREGLRVLVDARFRRERRGGDRCRFELARNISADGMQPKFLVYADTAKDLSSVVPSGCQIIATHHRPWHHPSGDWFEHIGLPRLARRLGIDVYHGTFNVLPAFAGYAPAPRMVVTIHDVAVFKTPEAYSRAFGLLARFLLRRAVSRAARIIAVSHATRTDLVALFPSAGDKTVVIPNGVGTEFLAAVALASPFVEEVTSRLGLSKPYVLFVGNLEKKKNLPRLIKAFVKAKLEARLPHRLVIVGNRPSGVPDSGLSGATFEGIVKFTGAVSDSDLPSIYKGADLVAYPSIYEGFGMPVLEGMAVGVPVLTSNVSSLPEVAGGAAMLVDPFSVESISSGLVFALSDQGWRRGAIGLGLARAKELSWERNAKQTAQVYRDVHQAPIGATLRSQRTVF
jgi:glycosyltransferase involved in cell wall biosynthesis